MPTVTKVWNNGRVIYQGPDDDTVVPEPALLIHRDSGGLLVIEQENRHITINLATVKTFVKELKESASEELDGNE